MYYQPLPRLVPTAYVVLFVDPDLTIMVSTATPGNNNEEAACFCRSVCYETGNVDVQYVSTLDVCTKTLWRYII